jgi:transposase-like protein
MDEKTEELRDIFQDVTDSDTVTESQEESRGSLTDQGGDVTERLESVVSSLQEHYEFDTDLSDDDYRRLLRSFYDGATDADLADELDVSRETVFRARMDLHCFRERDTDAPFDLDALRDRLDEAVTMNALADAFDVSPSTLRRYRRVLAAKDEARRANHRYQDEYETILADSDLSGRLTQDVAEDGLDEATEGMEVDVDF